VGEYSNIFLHHSLLTLSHLCNFTPRALHALLVWGFRLSDARILRPVADPSTLLRRRFLGLATSKVRRPGHIEGSSAQMRRRFISSAASFEHPSSREDSKVPSFFAYTPPPVSQSLHMLNHHKRHVNVSLSQDPLHASARRFLGWRIPSDASYVGGSSGEGYPSTLPGGRMRPFPNMSGHGPS